MLSVFCSLPVAVQLGLVVFFIIAGIKAYFKFGIGVCTSTNRLTGKTVIITGANTGIGKETAMDLAKRGARVILACRNPERAAAAQDDIIRTSGNKNVVVKILDLASLNSVRKFASDFLNSESRLDILINNAGCATMDRKLTEDGLEYQMQSNHFGHFLLTNLLLGLIIKTGNARIINVSSNTHRQFCKQLNVDDLNFERNPAGVKTLEIYGTSKLCNILFTKELARKVERFDNITVNALRPGIVHTEFTRCFPNYFHRKITEIAGRLFVKSAKEGAQTTIHLAVADEVANITGKYFSDCKMIETSQLANDAGLAKKLWEVSEMLVKLKPEERHY